LQEVADAGTNMDAPTVDLTNRPGFSLQFKMLLNRTWISRMKNKDALYSRMSVGIIEGFLMSLPYIGLKDNYSGLHSKRGVLLFVVMILGFSGMADMPVIFANRLYQYREKQSRMYSEFPLYLSEMLVNFPMQIWGDITVGIIVFFLCDFTINAETFFTYMLILIISDQALNAFSETLISISSSMAAVNMFNTLFITIWQMTAGFYVIPEQIPDYWIPFYWFNFIRWPLQALYINEFENLPQDEIIPGSTAAGAGITGRQFMEDLNLDEFTKWECLGITLLFGVFLKVVQFFVRKNMTHIKR